MKIDRQRLEILQAQANISATQLSAASGISRQQISSIKARGTCMPITAAKLAKGLGVQISEILKSET